MTVERRAYPRVADDKVSLRLKVDHFDTITHTLNISASGVYCKIANEIPVMSRVKIVMMFPDQNSSHEHPKSIEITGVVVREHPVIINGEIKHYDVAIFFDGLTQKEKEVIAQYVNRRLA